MEQRQVPRLNTNDIQAHEEAINSYRKYQEKEEACTLSVIQQLNAFRQKCRQSAAERSWVNEKRRLDSLEAAALKQISTQNESLSRLRCIKVADNDDDDDDACDIITCDGFIDVLSSLNKYAQEAAAPALVANRLIQAREELVSMGTDLRGVREKASRELAHALQDVNESLRALYESEHGEELYPDEVKLQIENLKKRMLVDGVDDASLDTDIVASLETDIVERFAAVYAEYEQKIAGGNTNSTKCSAHHSEASLVFNQKMKEATKWALKRLDEAIDSESNRQQQTALAMVQRALTEECHSRLKLLREAREKVANMARHQEAKRQLEEETRQLQMRALHEKEREQSKADIGQWKELQKKDQKIKQKREAQQRYQNELDRLDRMKANGKR